RLDLKLGLLAPLGQDDLARQYFDPFKDRFLTGRERRAGGDPGAEHAVLPAVGLDALAALVLDLLGGLQHGQAAVGILGIDPAALDKGVMIELRVGTEQRQPEAGLALERAVAGAVATAGLAQERLDVAQVARFAARATLGPALRGGRDFRALALV